MIQFQNWYETYLTSPVVAGTLVIPVNVPPTVTEGLLVLDYDQPSLREIIHYTSKDAVSVTVPASGDTGSGGTGRGYESTTARNHAQNAKVRMQFTAGTATSIQTAAAVIANQNNNGGWIARAETPVYATNNGNKEFTFTVPADLTAVISQGMKIKMDRVVAPPTQAGSFANASQQYATKATPSGISFTAAWTMESWLYLNSYGGSTGTRYQPLLSRFDNASTTGGWTFMIRPEGTVQVAYGTGATITSQATAQSLPLRRWVHLAATATAATKVINVYVNGNLWAMQAAFVAAATTMTQPAIDLRFGAYSATLGSDGFDGYAAELRLWSVAQTQSAIQSNMGINLTGSETNLVGLWKMNGNFNDATVNANNLTATNGAGFVTMATTPGLSYFNATEYFIVTGKPTYGAPNTTITAFGGTDNVLPNASMNNFYFSMQRAPFGFPTDKSKWMVEAVFLTDLTTAFGAVNSWHQHPSVNILVPTGAWELGFEGVLALLSSVSGTRSGFFAVEQTGVLINSNFRNPLAIRAVGFGTAEIDFSASKYSNITLAAAATYYVNASIDTASGSETWSVRAAQGQTILRAKCAYI